MFIAIRQMANLPVESMKTGGLAWFPDLTISDPYYVLPLMTVGVLYAAIEVGTVFTCMRPLTVTLTVVFVLLHWLSIHVYCIPQNTKPLYFCYIFGFLLNLSQ